MSRMPIIILLLNIVFLNGVILPCYCRSLPDQPKLEVIKGEVASINWVESTITIKYNQGNGDNDEVTLALTDSTKAMKDNVYISLQQVMKGDKVVVEYSDDPASFGPVEAATIVIAPSSKY